MKGKFLFLLTAALLFIGGIHATAQATLQPRNYYKVLVSLDTLTSTNADTIPIALSFDKVSYKYNYALKRTNVSGTSSVTFILQESNETSGTTSWYTIGTFSGTGATNANISGATTYGARHRIIGTNATGTTSYRLTARLTKL